MRMHFDIADVKNAFTQSDPLTRVNGEIFVEACEGLHLPPGSLIKLETAVYGLDEAPRRWRESVIEHLTDTGHQRSLLEPCWWYQREAGQIKSMVLLEVDDVLIATRDAFTRAQVKKSLERRFRFGLYKPGTPEGLEYAGRRVKFFPDKVTVDQENIILEEMHPIRPPKGKASKKYSTLDTAEFNALRFLCVQSQLGGTGVSPRSFTASRAITLWGTRSEDVSVITMSDAGGVGSKNDSIEEDGLPSDATQEAWLVALADKRVMTDERAKVSVLAWRSAKLKRRVASTLAGETLALSAALAEAEWIQVPLRDIVYGDVEVPDWRRSLAPLSAILRRECSLGGRLPQLHVVDAKSCYDALQREGQSSARDRRTAIEMAIIAEALGKAGGVVRWVPHPRMPVDSLTKDDIGKANVALHELIQSGHLILVDETEELVQRQRGQRSKSRTQAASRRIFQQNDDNRNADVDDFQEKRLQ